MRTLLAAAVLLGLLLPAGVDAKPFKSGRSETSARKAKSSRRTDNAPLVVVGASSKRSKRRADDPVLRRYGKRPQDVAYVEYDSDRADKPTKKSDVSAKNVSAKKSVKKSKKSKVVEAQADEEILIIEETKPAPAKKSKPKKPVVVDDDDDDDDDEITIVLD